MTPSRLPRPSANLVQSSRTKGALVIHTCPLKVQTALPAGNLRHHALAVNGATCSRY